MEWKNLFAKSIVCLTLSGGNSDKLLYFSSIMGAACLMGILGLLYQKARQKYAWLQSKREFPPFVNKTISFVKLAYNHLIELITDL